MIIRRGVKLDAFLKSLTRRHKYVFFFVLDLMLVVAALVVALALNPQPGLMPSVGVTLSVATPYLLILSGGALVTLGIPSVNLSEFDGHATLQAAALSLFLAIAGAVLARVFGLSMPMSVPLVFATSLFLMITTSRVVLLQLVLAIYRRSKAVMRVLIYGAGATGTQLVRALRGHNEIEPIAFVDDNPVLQGLSVSGLPVYTPVRVSEIAQSKRIDRVLLAIPSLSPPKQARIARRLQRLGLEVQTLPSFSQLIGRKPLLDRFEPLKPKMLLGRDEVDTQLLDGAESYRGKTILVSGAGGSIGSELCRQLIDNSPKRLILFELSEIALFTVHQELQNTARDQKVELVPVLGSVTDPRQVRQVLNDHDVEIVLHAAAYKHVMLVQQNPLAGLANNVLGTQTLANAAVRAGVERFILISSDKAVRPRGVMGASKRLAELVVQDIASRTSEGGPVLSVVRFGNVLGSSGSVVPVFQDQIRRGGPITVTHPHVTRYFMTIAEAARLVLRAGSMAEGGEVLLLDMGNPVKIVDLATQMIEQAGYTVQSDASPQGDIAIEFIGLRDGEKLHEELFFDGSERPTVEKKIFRLREAGLSEFEVADILRSLRHAMASGAPEGALDAMARHVPGFGASIPDVADNAGPAIRVL
ncbi:NDP-sugar epimerase, includes UDP-GlcNAc-inverting 4,6-dehydratase FlaA1 and capsular polysaccharide biosynthesis protein EpsC [Jannaschia faecimaris]|uniref:NDP-sugar epimerase, includes UDP-GlcNAc-inverting 4,6-dehydratase FlaA1 and capsular polysaccharide biosynthesis protein EpsC n=1 Tax=Jannaschia faecimaris TaxID=1244108 RepID=A0A1H3J0Q7_9RHOB|nr:nucleoside-diphosphate sugar epimerase/dehydratase [Jannaschia faecimaris]SDY33556.1 NDP-sugar epimerase, includes UDP-GlcNAc-inverting 4,6-dehydratase FlaA1 and capsular polysaccharide biosynthesis protein EpsC [Jannaschia faecimaris]